MTFASLRNFATNSSTVSTIIPPLRSVGASTLSTLIRGVMSRPRSAMLITSTGFFFAFRIFYTFANLGVLRRRSTVSTAGSDTEIFYSPKSTSLVTVALSFVSSIFELNVALGHPRIEASI